MGIWAPLEVRRDGDKHLWLSSGWGTLKLGLGNYIVIGRQITRAPDPAEEAARILMEIASAAHEPQRLKG